MILKIQKMFINFFTIIYNYIWSYILGIYEYFFNKNNKILEFPKNYNFIESKYDQINTIPESHPLVKTINSFLEKNYNDEKYLIVSLSGGVDSMVLISILWKLKNKFGYNLVAATINYSLRKESNDESNFTQEFCKKYGIEFHLKTISSVSRKKGENSRTEFEDTSRQLRYQLYKELLEKYKSKYIFVAHHYDDITENVFTNFMRGKNLLDLSVMHNISVINDVHIARPFLKHMKKDIYSLAHQFMIPYFLDTTPDWSNRGKMRRKVFPLLIDMFGNVFRKNLNNMGKNSLEIGNLLNSFVFEPYLNTVTYHKYGSSFNIGDKHNAPFLFWENVFMNIFHKMGSSMPSRKSIKLVKRFIKESDDAFYPIKKNFFIIISNGEIHIIKDIFQDINIKYNIEKKENSTLITSNNHISINDLLSGNVKYFLPEFPEKLELIQIKSNNILKKMNIIDKIPNQLLKNINMVSYLKQYSKNDLENITSWNEISLTF